MEDSDLPAMLARDADNWSYRGRRRIVSGELERLSPPSGARLLDAGGAAWFLAAGGRLPFGLSLLMVPRRAGRVAARRGVASPPRPVSAPRPRRPGRAAHRTR
jgi:hypothetical protein